MGCRRVASVPACEPRLNHPVSVEVCHLAAPAYVRAANPVVECAQQHSAKGLRSCLLNGKWLLVARLYLDRSRGRQPCTINGMADRRCALTRYPQTRVRVLRSTTRRHGTIRPIAATTTDSKCRGYCLNDCIKRGLCHPTAGKASVPPKWSPKSDQRAALAINAGFPCFHGSLKPALSGVGDAKVGSNLLEVVQVELVTHNLASSNVGLQTRNPGVPGTHM